MSNLDDDPRQTLVLDPATAVPTGEPAQVPPAAVLRALPLAACVLDPAGVVRSANAAWCELLQIRAESCPGRPLLEWVPRASDAAAFGREFRELLARPVGASVHPRLTLAAPLGRAFPVQVHARKVRSDSVLLVLERVESEPAPGAEMERAVARSLDALDQGVLLLGADGRVVHANPAAQDLFGGELAGRNFLAMADSDTVEELGRALALGTAGGWRGEVHVRRLDGEPIPLEVSLAVAAGDGAPAVVLLRDLREGRRKMFESRVLAQIDRCLASTSDPREGVLAACAAVGQALGTGRVDLFVRMGEAWERWSVDGDVQAVTSVPAEREPPRAWSEDSGPVQLAAGEAGAGPQAGPGLRVTLRAPSGLVGYLVLRGRDGADWDPRDRDLLTRGAAQIALGVANGLLTLRTRALAEYQAMLLDQTSVLLDSLDDAGRVVTWNRASEQLLGVPAHRALGRCFGLDVARCEDPGRWEELWSELRAHGAFTAEVSLLAEEDGRAVPVPLHLEGRVLRDGGRLRGAVLVGLDLRARRALETQVLQSQKLAAVGLLAAGIAHEINNPLSGVVGYAKLLLGRGDLDPLVRERVEKIAASGERCRKIVEGVLLFARRQGGGVRKTVALHTLLDRVISLGEYQWRMHNVQVVRDPSDEVEVEADPERIEQVLLNLLSNAVDAMPHGGTIRVGLVRERGWARVEVQDQGEGIAPDVQSRIFDPFFSTKDLGKGTGLGLAISYGIVEDHGGTITVASAPGEGATFTVRLPQAAPVGPSTLESEPPAP